MTTRITVIGGGYAGTKVARKLDKNFSVTVVEPRDKWIHNVGSIRAVTDPTLLEQIVLPYDNLLKNGKIIRDRVTSIDQTSVEVAGGDTIDGDIVIIATGSNYALPFKMRGDQSEDFERAAREVADRVSDAERFAIVGAGPVGIELAGELAVAYPHKHIDLISRDSALFPEMSAKLGQRLAAQLIDLGVDIHYEKTVENLEHTDRPFTGTITPAGGRSISADLVFPALGTRINRGLLQTISGAEFDGLGRIKVDRWLRPASLTDVYAVGDAVSAGDPMTIVGLTRQVGWLVKTISSLEGGKGIDSIKPYSPWPVAPILVPLGPKKGNSLLPGMVAGPFLTSAIKGKTLFIPRCRKDFHLK